jgi:hypothetical protein
MSTDTAIARIAPIEGGLSLLGDPQKMLDQAKKVADVLMKLVKEQELYQKIGDREHLYVEAWETCAHFYGISAKIVEVRPIIDEITGAAGFEAIADALRMSDGQVISSGRGMCLNNEDNWNTRPKYEYEQGKRVQTGTVRVPTYQLASMAQTRAIGKVLRNVLAFVVALAGYATTPAEEMTGDEQSSRDREPGREPERKSAQQNGNHKPDKISDPQRKRLFAIAHEVSCPMNTLGQIVTSFGFDIAANISRDKYDAVVTAVQNWQQQPQK